MAIASPYSQYVQNQVVTATPGKLLILAYDTAAKFGREAQQSMRAHRLDEQSASIKKMQNVLIELMSALNHEADPKLCANLDALYTYCFDRLSEACIRDNEEALAEVIQIMGDLRSAWADACHHVQGGAQAA